MSSLQKELFRYIVFKRIYAQFIDDSIGNTIHSNSDGKREPRGLIQQIGFPSIKEGRIHGYLSRKWVGRGSDKKSF